MPNQRQRQRRIMGLKSSGSFVMLSGQISGRKKQKREEKKCKVMQLLVKIITSLLTALPGWCALRCMGLQSIPIMMRYVKYGTEVSTIPHYILRCSPNLFQQVS